MSKREEFTSQFPDDMAYDRRSRLQKAKKMVAILKDHFGNLSNLICVDVGCSVGIITDYLARDFKKVIGVDVDTKALRIARRCTSNKNVTHKLSKENKLPLRNNSVDVAIFSQIYEHAENPQKLVDEIYRILKPGGVCFFSARNKYGGPFDGHYKLPFISWFPRSLSNIYIRAFSDKKEYDITLFPLWKLNKLIEVFDKRDYTLASIRDPVKFKSQDVVPTVYGINKLLGLVAKMVYVFIPNYLWILVKKEN